MQKTVLASVRLRRRYLSLCIRKRASTRWMRLWTTHLPPTRQTCMERRMLRALLNVTGLIHVLRVERCCPILKYSSTVCISSDESAEPPLPKKKLPTFSNWPKQALQCLVSNSIHSYSVRVIFVSTLLETDKLFANCQCSGVFVRRYDNLKLLFEQ